MTSYANRICSQHGFYSLVFASGAEEPREEGRIEPVPRCTQHLLIRIHPVKKLSINITMIRVFVIYLLVRFVWLSAVCHSLVAEHCYMVFYRYFETRISEAAMYGAENIIFHSLGGLVKRNTPEFEPVGKNFASGKLFTWAALVRIPDIKIVFI